MRCQGDSCVVRTEFVLQSSGPIVVVVASFNAIGRDAIVRRGRSLCERTSDDENNIYSLLFAL